MEPWADAGFSNAAWTSNQTAERAELELGDLRAKSKRERHPLGDVV